MPTLSAPLIAQAIPADLSVDDFDRIRRVSSPDTVALIGTLITHDGPEWLISTPRGHLNSRDVRHLIALCDRQERIIEVLRDGVHL